MTHPDDLLAELEGGAIAEGDRATLERHLASCARCREQVAMARAARRALASVPDAQAPADIGALAIEEARNRPAGRSSWYRWGGVAIGIAAALVLLALVAPKIGPKSELRTAAAEGSTFCSESRRWRISTCRLSRMTSRTSAKSI